MKAKHIVSAILIIILPFVIIFGFGALSDYLKQMANRTFMFSYIILNQLAVLIPIIAYIFWLSFVMRPKLRKAKFVFMYCTFAATAFLLLGYFVYWFVPFPLSNHFVSSTALICALANMFAGFYMLVKGKKYEEN